MPLVVSSEFCIPEEVAAVALPTATLSVIIRAYNEIRTVVEILQRVLRQPVVSEIVLVDDGSTDGTWEAVRQFAESAGPSDRDRLILLQHTKNRGKGRAIRTALDKVSGSHILIQDADLEYDPADLNKLWAVMQSGEVDVVFGSRYLDNPKLQKGRWIMQSGVRLLNLLVLFLHGVRLTDHATCYKMFRAADLRAMKLQYTRFEFCAEVTAAVAEKRMRVREVAISYTPRSRAEGKKLHWTDGLSAAACLCRSKAKIAARSLVCQVLLIASAWFFVIWILALMSFGSLSAAAAWCAGAPIYAVTDTVELRIAPGAKRQFEIRIRRLSDQPVTIVTAIPDCSCISVLNVPLLLEERASEFSLKFEYQAPNRELPFLDSHEIEIISDTSTPPLKVVFVADVSPDWDK